MTGQEKGDLLIQVTAWAGLTGRPNMVNLGCRNLPNQQNLT